MNIIFITVKKFTCTIQKNLLNSCKMYKFNQYTLVIVDFPLQTAH